MLLSDLLAGADFVERIQSISLESRKKLGIDAPVYQLGVVVPDVVAAAADLEKRGLRPFLLMGGSARSWNERGSDGDMKSRLGFGYYHGIEIELLEPGTGSDFYRRCLDRGGRPVVQHLGFLVRDVDQWANKLVAAGFPVYVRGRLGVGPLRIEFAYMDTEKEAGLILEFICHRLFGIWIRPPIWIQQLIGWIEIKAGKRCLDM